MSISIRPVHLLASLLIVVWCSASSDAVAQSLVVETQWSGYGSDPGELSWPRGIAWSGGEVWIAEWTNARVSHFEDDGTFLSTWGVQGTGAGNFDLPLSIAVVPGGGVYTLEAQIEHRVQKFSADGDPQAQWGTYGTEAGEFQAPTDVHVAGDRVYVADYANSRIQEFSLAGGFQIEWTYVDSRGVFAPSQVAVAPNGEIYVVETDYSRVLRFDADRSFMSVVVDSGATTGSVDAPSDLAIDGNGNLYVTEQGSTKRLQKFGADGTFLDALVLGPTVCPEALALTDSGTILIADDCGNQVVVVHDLSVAIFADGFESGDTGAW